jgi:hypothetical protein
MTDELVALPVTLGTDGPYTRLDSRQNPTFSPISFHKLRAQAREARGFLKSFAPDSSPALQAHTYALEGYAEILLADLFCSGIPLSTVDFDGDYTLAAGSTTLEVYSHALALFDTALALASDSVRIRHLAALGRGRSLLALGEYASAAAAVTGVPDDYRYQAIVNWNAAATTFSSGTTSPPDTLVLMWYWSRSTASGSNNRRLGGPSVGDQEGGNGLNYRTSSDPRVHVTITGQDQSANPLFRPTKYGTTSPIFLTPASGIEARLIEAEAALQSSSGEWLAKLNALRQSPATCGTIVPATTTTCPLATLDDPGASLSDPAAAKAARVDLLFRERAFWLFLDGHRQGDVRRLVRQYSRDPFDVYPMGSYPGGKGEYGEQFVLPMPDEERQLNPKYTGCFNQNV